RCECGEAGQQGVQQFAAALIRRMHEKRIDEEIRPILMERPAASSRLSGRKGLQIQAFAWEHACMHARSGVRQMEGPLDSWWNGNLAVTRRARRARRKTASVHRAGRSCDSWRGCAKSA